MRLSGNYRGKGKIWGCFACSAGKTPPYTPSTTAIPKEAKNAGMGNGMSKIQFYVQKIRKYYPGLVIDSAKFNQDGQYNDVLIVNESLVFRFAKVQAAIKTLGQEVLVLRNLQDHISLRIPNPTYVNLEPEIIGDVFVGYEIIPGKPLWRDQFAQIASADVRKKLAIQLASFFRHFLNQD